MTVKPNFKGSKGANLKLMPLDCGGLIGADGVHVQTSLGRVRKGERPDPRREIRVLLLMLIDVGCVEALNLDGGGSSCMLINGKETIKPSDAAGERAVPAVFIIK